ncbi:MAG TPA: hypothetical protein VF729_03835, partial [Solirubrobacterales bacterium]
MKAWGWDVAPQGAPGDTAPDALETCGPPVPDEAPPPGLCQSGSEGPGKGQLSRPNGIAVDAAGAIHVLDRANLRVQKFSPEGQFELMFGGKVNKTKVESGAPAAEQNVCPVDPADICQAGSPGEAPSHLAGTVGNYIAYNSASDAIVIGDKDRIQVFELDGAYREAIPFEGALAAFSGESVNALDVDPSGNVYFSLSGLEDVFKVGPAGTPLAPGKPEESKFDVGVPLAVAVDHDGNVYAIDDPPDILPDTEGRVVKFDAAGNRLIPTKGEEEAERFFPYVPYQGPRLNGIATNICAGSPEPGNLYVAAFKASEVSYLDAYGSGPIGCEPPPPRPPVITTQYATSVGSTSARLQALINPKFLNDTTYYVEYGLAPCSEGGCTSQAPAPAAVLTSQVTNKALKTAIVSLGGLKPGATYHYRFVAQSGGGGPVFGEDADGKEGPEEASFEAGVERTFTTFKTQTTPSACPNDVFRIGPGALLPDCRAYEMVSPLDKEGGDVALWSGKNALVPLYFELNQSAPSGERFAFTSAYPFAGSESAPYVSQYLAERGSGGWKSESISPSRSEIPVQLDNFENDFQGFSADLCQAWLRHNSVAPLVPGAIAGYPNLYRRENCGESPALEPSTTTKPPHRIPNKYRLLMRGASDDGSHSIFVANDKLHPDAPTLP